MGDVSLASGAGARNTAGYSAISECWIAFDSLWFVLKVASLSAETLAAVLDQSVDCVKLLGLDGDVVWMNGNGLCAMEIDDFTSVRGQQWSDLWPEGEQARVLASLSAARGGDHVRFDAFCPTAKGNDRWWNVTVSAVKDLAGHVTGFLAISRDVTETELGRQALVISAQELRHRLKNTYMMIGSLLHGFARGVPENEAFAREMQQRLISLSAAQALFSSENVPCEIASLIPALTLPFETQDCPITLAGGSNLRIGHGQADAIALVLGELAVNSAKHGALAHGGSIAVGTQDDGRTLSIVWTESMGIPVAGTERAGGQGLRLIERIVRARRGTFAMDWQRYGVTVTLEFSLT